MLLNVVTVDVPTCANVLHDTPVHRSTRYPVTATLSVDAVQLRLIWFAPATLPARPVGAVGAVVSTAAGVVAVTMLEFALTFPAASTARTRPSSCPFP